VVVDSSIVKDQLEDDLSYDVLTNINSGKPCVSYSGFSWALSGDFKNVAARGRYVGDFAARLGSPVEVKLEKR
jgi:hypothetical protein